MATVRPYPHYRINVKDNSIATVTYDETLPVCRPLFVLRAQKGEVGKPVWCPSYTIAKNYYGAETFDTTNPLYFSRPAYFLKNMLTYDGAFIVRYAPTDAATAFVIIEAQVKEAQVPKYAYTAAGSHIYIRDATTGELSYAYEITVSAYAAESLASYKAGDQVSYNSKYYEALITPPTAAPSSVTDANWKLIDTPTTADPTTAAKVAGLVISYTTRYTKTTDEETDLLSMHPVKTTADGVSTWTFPIVAMEAQSVGLYGNDLAFSLYYYGDDNASASVIDTKSVFYRLAFFQREYNSTTVDSVMNIYNQDSQTFAINPEAINNDTGTHLDLTSTLSNYFNDTTYPLPVDVYSFEDSIRSLGDLILAEEMLSTDTNTKSLTSDVIAMLTDTTFSATQFNAAAVKGFYFGTPVTDEAANFDTNGICAYTHGYLVNVLSGINLNGNPYDCTVVNTSNSTVTTDYNYLAIPANSAFTTLGSDTYIYLDKGADGALSDATDDQAMADFCNKKYPADGSIVDKARYPFTHIFDVGYSMDTKYAILDFLDVRDDFMAIMSTQKLLQTDATAITINDQASDEDYGNALRSHALLMRESVLRGTDCCRCAIYGHSGIPSDTTMNGYVPFTFWAAMQYAQYGNKTYMAIQEPRGTPYSYNELFKSFNWINFSEEGQSRVWDKGINYCQYADMTRIFYPSLRTVYRADTSVLVDEWFVAAVVYTKHEIRKTWVRFTGRNDRSSVIQAAIQQDLTDRLTTLYNGKYTFSVTVYQTEEEKKIGYIQHVLVSITSPATMRVLDVDIEVNRENYSNDEEAEE